MGKRALIAYASKHGATQEIAERIASVIVKAGHEADTIRIQDVANIQSYDGVIIGSAVYIGQWRKEASRFLKKSKEILAQKPVWIFSTGPTGEGDPLELVRGVRLPKKLQPVADHINPREIKVFHGAITVEKLGGFEKWALNRVDAATGDFRVWSSVDQWAGGIAEAL